MKNKGFINVFFTHLVGKNIFAGRNCYFMINYRLIKMND